jgi:hypothetical protein
VWEYLSWLVSFSSIFVYSFLFDYCSFLINTRQTGQKTESLILSGDIVVNVCKRLFSTMSTVEKGIKEIMEIQR